uniref:Uncharacterized protein n=1 Tax=viral metagenome TaxID=1070528 RepID=A0A6C0I7T2_9ZZZZ
MSFDIIYQNLPKGRVTLPVGCFSVSKGYIYHN